jgi:hypothetical protein
MIKINKFLAGKIYFLKERGSFKFGQKLRENFLTHIDS